MEEDVHLVDLVKSFLTNIYLQNLASIQPRTSRHERRHSVGGHGLEGLRSTQCAPFLNRPAEKDFAIILAESKDHLQQSGRFTDICQNNVMFFAIKEGNKKRRTTFEGTQKPQTN